MSQNKSGCLSSTLLVALIVSVILNIAINSDTDDKGPSENNNKWSSYLFFISFILIGVMFFLNLFMGVIFSNFLRAQRKTNNQNLDNNQYKYLQIVNTILEAKPYLYVRPLSGIKRIGYDIVQGNFFELLMFVYSFYYICLLAFYKDGSPAKYFRFVSISSVIMVILINFECCVKLMCLSWKGFISSRWNVMQILIAIIFNITLLFTEFLLEYIKLEKNFLIIRIFLMTRMIIFLRIYQKFYFFRKLLRVLRFSISLYVNLAFLFILTMFVYGLFGYVMYSSIMEGNLINKYLNFKNILYSIFILLKIAVCDDWSYVVFDCLQKNALCGPRDTTCRTSNVLCY